MQRLAISYTHPEESILTSNDAPLKDGWTREEVNVIGTGRTTEDPRRPDIPEDAHYEILEDNETTMLIDWLQPV